MAPLSKRKKMLEYGAGQMYPVPFPDALTRFMQFTFGIIVIIFAD